MMTKVVKLDSDTDYWNTIREAAALLADGGLVVFPTETVYGLGTSAVHPEGLKRLRQLKSRTDGKPFTVHIGSRSAAERFVPELAGSGRLLVEKAWPGPLTLIFRVDDASLAPVIRETSLDHIPAMYHDQTVGLRCPDDRAAADLLTTVQSPVVAASANLAGSPAPVDAEEALEALDGQVDLVLDAGRTRYAKPSTIVRVNRDGYEILREGVMDERTIRRLIQTNFLIVCSGNTCRSPMAEGLLRRLLAERLACREEELADRGYHVESAGTSAVDGMPVSSQAVQALKARGIDISHHQSRALRVEQINRADRIYTMTAGHIDSVKAVVAGAERRSWRIADEDIMDPIGGDDRVYVECAERIERALRQRLEEVPL